MPIEYDGQNVVRVYYGYSLKFVATTCPPGGAPQAPGPIAGTPCPVEGSYATYGGICYQCQIVGDEEAMRVEYDGEDVHRRTTITYLMNDGSGGTYNTQVRTWGVESVTNPGTPTRSGYTFNGWFTSASGGSLVSFPFTAPLSDATYYAQWTVNVTATPTIKIRLSGNPPLLVRRYVSVQNNDSSAATINLNSYSPPDTSIGSVGAGETSLEYRVGAGQVPSFPVYATATATGKATSTIVSNSGGL